MKIKPYIIGGIGGNPLKTYYIRDGNAEVESFPGKRSSIPLSGAEIEVIKTTILGRGTIKITGAGRSVQEWTNLRNVEQVYKDLKRARQGLPLEESKSDEQKPQKKDPPENIIFGTQVAFIPRIPSHFDVPLWMHNPNVKSFGVFYFDEGNWVGIGDKILSFSINYGSIRLPIYSSASGLVLNHRDSFGSELEEDGHFNYYNSMYEILLPKNGYVPKTIEEAVEEFCNLCWQYRRPEIFNEEVIKKLGNYPNDYSKDETINKFLAEFKQRKIIVKDLSELDDEFKIKVEKLKVKYPKNF